MGGTNTVIEPVLGLQPVPGLTVHDSVKVEPCICASAAQSKKSGLSDVATFGVVTNVTVSAAPMLSTLPHGG
jgi:hypothetical protein